ncbi:pseudouridine synthase [Flammeovirga agarivorans]|uniref:Pseudouridine synthase n=1 Tax=Flammeovirga agarivorans TaxID=2726742 RepID=A0A7X8SKZ7_9BACT|nr:pseudouridine synthase [Flammeovirga agarivorans]NLR92052.1 pseudouridine synthase [Flammeovirga agarivorans]
MSEYRYFVVNKPYGVLPQFSDHDGRKTLKSLGKFPSDVYPVGRLDLDSEGLLIITNDKMLNHKLLNPKFEHNKTYLVQVEGDITDEAIKKLEKGTEISVNKTKYKTLPARCKKVEKPENLEERDPPVRFRKNIPTSFIELTIHEGKNRQVRKMTASVGFPCLRLIRLAVEDLRIVNLPRGGVIELDKEFMLEKLKLKKDTGSAPRTNQARHRKPSGGSKRPGYGRPKPKPKGRR